MLRAALDCGAGDTATFEQAMQLILSAPPPGGAAISTSNATYSVAAGTQTANTSTDTESMNYKRPELIESNNRAEASNKECPKSMDSSAGSFADSITAQPQQQSRQSEQSEEQSPAVALMAGSLQSAGALQTAGPTAADLPDLLSRTPRRGGLLRLRHLDTAPAR